MTSRRAALLCSNLLVLALAVTALLRVPTAVVDQRLLDAPLQAPGQWFDSQRGNAGGEVTVDAYERALAQARAAGERTAAVDPALAEATWTHLGPTGFGGRVADIAVDPLTADTVYAATASGGVWKSTDRGLTWRSSWPADVTQAMGAIGAARDGTLYAGTGEPNPGGGSITYGGTGLYKSTDGGATWERAGLRSAGAFGRIVADPTDAQRVFAAAAGNLYVPGGQRGLYRSDDAGKTWKRVLQGDNDTTGAVDVAVDPANPNNVLATMWDHVRYETHRVYAGVGSGVYRSADGGDTWTEVELPGNVKPEDVGRIGVAFAPSDPRRAYAIVSNKLDGTGVGLWRSDDGGATWARTAASVGSLTQSSFGWWFGRVFVDPADADRVFVPGVELNESTDGGDRFVAHSSTLIGVLTGAFQAGPALHADQHAMAWDPKSPGRVYVGNDGGTYRSDANATIGSWVAAVSQGWTQHYSVDVGEQRPDYLVSGLQDNLCQRNPAGANPANWTKYGICGDGLQTLINPVDESFTYACSQYGFCGVQRFGVPDPRRLGLVGARPPGQRYGWMTPLEFDPSDPSVMYFGSNVLSRSTDNGITWTPISPDLTTNPEQLDPNAGYRIYGTITAVAAAASDPNVLYVGTDDGLLWTTKDLGKTWTPLSDENLPGTWVTSVAVDPDDAAVAYAAFSGFRDGADTPHVVRTTDGGATWENISGDLPDAPVNDLIVVRDSLVAATDVGVFLSSDGGATWLRVGANLPTVPVIDVRHHAGTNTLTAATFGHGIQRVALPG
jgi:photosystem II stability/assembly factor-like uncharacterized protein